MAHVVLTAWSPLACDVNSRADARGCPVSLVGPQCPHSYLEEPGRIGRGGEDCVGPGSAVLPAPSWVSLLDTVTRWFSRTCLPAEGFQQSAGKRSGTETSDVDKLWGLPLQAWSLVEAKLLH